MVVRETGVGGSGGMLQSGVVKALGRGLGVGKMHGGGGGGLPGCRGQKIVGFRGTWEVR